MVDGISPLQDNMEVPDAGQKNNVRRLYLRFPNREDPRLRKVKLVLSMFPGEEPIILYFEDCKKRVGTYGQIHPALVEDLTGRLGKENVVVK